MKTLNKKIASVSMAGITALGVVSIPAIASAGIYGIPDSHIQKPGFEMNVVYHGTYYRKIHYLYYSSDVGYWGGRCTHTFYQYKEYKYPTSGFYSWLPRSIIRYFNLGHWEWITRKKEGTC